MTCRTLIRLIFWLMPGLALSGSPSAAAVSECLPEMRGALKSASAELEARKLALDDWLAKAAQIGPGYTRWQIAWGRRIVCQKTATQVACQAIAQPCTIKQVPTPGLQPLKRGPEQAS